MSAWSLSTWVDRWRNGVRATETSLVVGLWVGAIESSDMLTYSILLGGGLIVGIVALATDPARSRFSALGFSIALTLIMSLIWFTLYKRSSVVNPDTLLIEETRNFTKSIRTYGNNFHAINEQESTKEFNRLSETHVDDAGRKVWNENLERTSARRVKFSNQFLLAYRPEAIRIHAVLLEKLLHIGIVPPADPLDLVIPGRSGFDLFMDGIVNTRSVDDRVIDRLADNLDSLAFLFPASEQPKPVIDQ